MGHCVHIYFECKAEKNTAFGDLLTLRDVETIGENTIRINDSSSNSKNFAINKEDFIEIEIEVKTRNLSMFILDKLGRYHCLVKDCEDSEEEAGEPLTTFFRC